MKEAWEAIWFTPFMLKKRSISPREVSWLTQGNTTSRESSRARRNENDGRNPSYVFQSWYPPNLLLTLGKGSNVLEPRFFTHDGCLAYSGTSGNIGLLASPRSLGFLGLISEQWWPGSKSQEPLHRRHKDQDRWERMCDNESIAGVFWGALQHWEHASEQCGGPRLAKGHLLF